MIEEYLKKRLSDSTKVKLRKLRKLRNFLNDIRAFGHGFNLNKLGLIYGTDKFGRHFYTPHYMTHLRKYKYKKINLLEIVVGGYEIPDSGGQSLRMWKKYFPFGRIYSIDIYDKSKLQENRIKIFKGSQIDQIFLGKITKKIKTLDIIIDDGSHLNEHVITSFKILFPKLKDGGIYVIEDTQTSYWEDFGGNSNDLTNSNTMMNFFKSLTDSLNNKEFIIKNYKQTYYDRKIISIHFYHNLIFIYKGNNKDESNIVIKNQR